MCFPCCCYCEYYLEDYSNGVFSGYGGCKLKLVNWGVYASGYCEQFKNKFGDDYMTYEEFERYIKIVQDCNEKITKISDIIDSEFFVELTGYLMDAVCDLLERHFEDENGWVAYWMWDLNFGKEYRDGKVQIECKNVPLETIEDLYKVLS